MAQSTIFAGIHEVTGFIENADLQTELAQWGIRYTMALIPMICTIIALIIFWVIYNLTPEKVNYNKKRLLELNL